MIKLLKFFSPKNCILQYYAAVAITGAIREMQRKKIIQNYVWSPFNKDAGIENYVSFL